MPSQVIIKHENSEYQFFAYNQLGANLTIFSTKALKIVIQSSNASKEDSRFFLLVVEFENSA